MYRIRIYYDGLCHLCIKEIEHYMKIDRERKLDYIDISTPSLNASEHGLNPKLVQKYFHIKGKDDKIVTGVESFYKIWVELDTFKPLQKLYKTPVIKQTMDFGYLFFAQIRPYLPKPDKCHNGACEYR